MYTVTLTERQLQLIKMWLDAETFAEFKALSGAPPSEIYKLVEPFKKAVKS
jgi:hypothetical protein